MTELPPGWASTTTGALLDFVTSGSRGWARYYSDRGSSFIRVGNLRRGSITPDLRDIQHVSPPDGAEGQRTRVAPGDILISITADLGRVALITDVQEPTYINQHVALARPSPGVNARFLAWYLTTDTVQRQWAGLQRGATKLGLGLHDIKLIDVPLAPYREQLRIVAAIEEQFSRLDAGCVALERVWLNLKRLRAAVFRAAMSGALTETNLSLWAPRRLVDVAVIASGQTPRGLELADHGPIPFYKVGDMNSAHGRFMAASRGYIDLASARRFGLHVRPAGTVIFPKRGGAIATNKKRILRQSAAYDLNTIGLIPGPELIPHFLYLWIGSIDLNGLADGSNVPQINHGDLADLRLQVPPKDEQERVVAAADTMLSLLDGLEDVLSYAEARARRLRSAILAAAFSGQLVPQDPADEPSSQLLRRIIDERASNGHRLCVGHTPCASSGEVTA